MKQAVIDIGSNTIRLVVYRCVGKKIFQLLNTKNYASLISYHKNGIMTPAGVEIATNVVTEQVEVATVLGVKKIDVIATASLRNISNNEEIINKIFEKTRLLTRLLTGKQEAYFGLMGMLSAYDTNNGICVDLGGGSFEITQYENRLCINSISIDGGCLSLYEEFVSGLLPTSIELSNLKKSVNKKLKEIPWINKAEPQDFYIIGGTGRALARLHRGLSASTQDINGYCLKVEEISETVDTICQMGLGGVKYLNRVLPERLTTALPGITVLSCIAKRCNAKKATISKYGLREGYITSEILEHSGGKIEWLNETKKVATSTES